MTQEDTSSERYEVDGEWLKSKIEALEAGLASLVSKQSESKTDSDEQQSQTQTTPSEIQVQQNHGRESQEESQKKSGPKSRLTIRFPKMSTR